MFYLITALDPRLCYVVLDKFRYETHIKVRHPGVEPEFIQAAIENPDIITTDSNNNLGENYYVRGVIPDAPSSFLKVCVRLEGSMGKVVTAFEVDRPKPSEAIIWLK